MNKNINKFRKIRLFSIFIIVFILLILNLLGFTSSKISLYSFITKITKLFFIVFISHITLSKIFKNGILEEKRILNYINDTLIFFLIFLIYYNISILLFGLFIYMLCMLGYAPHPS